MTFRLLARFIAMAAVVVLTTRTAGAWPHRQGQRARVQFVATSTLIRGTWGQNEDAYLVKLLFPKQNETVLVRLIDTYPNEFPPLSREVLSSDRGSVLSLKRDAGCDRPFGEVLLRTAPGNPLAILLERLSYRPRLDRTPEAETILPCYRTIRR